MLLLFGKKEQTMKLFDTHSHYNDEAFDKDREEIIKQIFEVGVANTVVVRR